MLATTFYSYSALSRQPSWESYARYAVILIGALLLVWYLVYHLRHRDVTKYRDLLIILVLVELLTIGIQIRDFQNNRSASANSSPVTSLLKSVAGAENVKPTRLFTNSTSLTDGMLVQIDRKANRTFTVTLSADNSSFQLTKTHLIDASQNTYVK